MCVAQCQRLDYNWQTDTKSVFKLHYTMARKQLTTSTFYTCACGYTHAHPRTRTYTHTHLLFMSMDIPFYIVI